MIKTGRWYNPNAKIFYSEIQLWRIMNTSHDPSNEPILGPENQSKRDWGKLGLRAGVVAVGAAVIGLLPLLLGESLEGLLLIVYVTFPMIIIAVGANLAGIVMSISGARTGTASQSEARAGTILNAALLLVFIVSLVPNAFVLIRSDERGIVISAVQPNGYRQEVLDPGLHWILPFVESTKVCSVAPQTYIMASSSNQGDDSIKVQSRDGQNFTISVVVTYSIDPAKVVELHLVWQDRYQENAVRPLIRAFVRDIASEYTALEIMGPAKRAMEQSATEQLNPKFAENDLILINFEITDVRQVGK